MSTTFSNFSEPTIVTNNDLNHRSFVSFIFNNKPQRQYNGKCIGLPINPNRAKSITEKRSLLNKLRFELHKALEAGQYPLTDEITKEPIAQLVVDVPQFQIHEDRALRLLFDAVKLKLKSNLSKKYKRNLKTIYRQFRLFMTDEEKNGRLASLSMLRIDKFLSSSRQLEHIT